MAEQYCYMFLIMCKAVLKSLNWQKESSQIIVQVTDLVLTHSCMYSDPLTKNNFKEFSSHWNKFRVSDLKMWWCSSLICLFKQTRTHPMFPWLIHHSSSFNWKEVSRDFEFSYRCSISMIK